MSEDNRAWSLPVRLEAVPPEGLSLALEADEDTRAAVARLAGLRTLPRLQARFDVSRHGAGGLRVRGEVSATVGQTCVVTLEPLDNELREGVDLVFEPPSASRDQKSRHRGDVENAPEELREGAVDLGLIAVEFMLLGLDPYPRKPGVRFEAPSVDDAREHPFAALAALKDAKKGGAG